MNKTAIKNFAIWARNKLIADINYRAGLLGITKDGIHSALPQSSGQTQFYDIGTAEPYAITGAQIYQRQHLVDLLRQKEKESDYKTAYKYVLEEVAYTWFNRLIAVRFMEVNDYLPSHIRVLSSESGKLEPDLVTTPFDADLEFSKDEQQTILDLKNTNKLDEVFRLLFIKQCNALNEILPALFEKTSDYTELLLNLSVIDQDGVVWHLVHDIPESDFNVEEGGQVEIIGWLYQYYNTEPKNEAFAKKGKITKDEVPAVTQLFTPDWIVRYMVENSLGRLWVEGHPNEELKSNWKYYLEEAEQEPEVTAQLEEIRKEYAKLNPEDIKVIDPCMGSGHILVYAFDVLMQIYESAGYGQRDAARSILENNIYGLDIDDRAFQMAYFAVMMKARQYNRRILNGEYMPNVYSIQESNGINRNQLKYFGKGLNELEKNNAINQITGLLDTFVDAKEYGSILNVDPCDWDLLMRFAENIHEPEQMDLELDGIEETQGRLLQMVCQGKVLGQKYEVASTNPPYMGSGSMNNRLSQYVKKHYPDGKVDLFSVFIIKCLSLLPINGYMSMITQQSWMFLSSFEQLRLNVGHYNYINMAHLGARAFEEIAGEVVQTTAFVLQKQFIENYKGIYKRLVHPTSQKGKENLFLKQGSQYIINQNRFLKIPGHPIAYWLSDSYYSVFSKNVLVEDVAQTFRGLQPGNTRFVKEWFEVSYDNIDWNNSSDKTWYPMSSGGESRRWYGNLNRIVNWRNQGEEIKKTGKAIIPNESLYFKPVIGWSRISSGPLALRCYDKNLIPGDATGCIYSDTIQMYVLLGALNSSVVKSLWPVLNSNMTNSTGIVSKVPVPEISKISEEIIQKIRLLVIDCVEISKAEWNSHETSWSFNRHPLLIKENNCTENETNHTTVLADKIRFLKNIYETNRFALRDKEQALNDIFAKIYGLQEEVNIRVDINDISLREFNENKIIKELISYSVGNMFGRFSLDWDGVAFAGGKWKEDRFISFTPDEDNIIPITDEEYLEDDIVSRFCDWIKKIYGYSSLEENLDYIASVLGSRGDTSREKIRNYFVNNFYSDHCQMYTMTGSGKRPIYWLFDSGKQNGFKALIYLHRYNADTIGNLRIDYLHRMQRIYESEINRMQDMIDHSTNAREAAQATKRREKLTKQLKECREYDEKLAHLALSRIELDLDDGVKVNYRKLQTASDGKFYEVLADSKNIMSKK